MGLGMVLAEDEQGGLVVDELQPGKGAAQSGNVLPGDQLIEIDGHPVLARELWLSMCCVCERVRVCMRLHTHTHTHTHTDRHAHAQRCIYTQTHAHM